MSLTTAILVQVGAPSFISQRNMRQEQLFIGFMYIQCLCIKYNIFLRDIQYNCGLNIFRIIQGWIQF